MERSASSGYIQLDSAVFCVQIVCYARASFLWSQVIVATAGLDTGFKRRSRRSYLGKLKQKGSQLSASIVALSVCRHGKFSGCKGGPLCKPPSHSA